jgi:hypothetical protein
MPSVFAVTGALIAGLALAPSSARAADPGPVPTNPAPNESPMAPMGQEEPAPAVEESMTRPEEEPSKVYHGRLVVLGLKLGAAINAFNTLGPAFTPELEIGFLLPFLEQSFEVFVSGRWAAPSDEGKMDPDPRLPGDGVASWEVTRNELSLGLGLRYRIPLDGAFTPYLGAGLRVYLLSTEVEGSADGQPFGKNEETGTAVGFLFQLGGEYALGPGALLLELAVNGAGLDQTILADTNVSSFDVYLGYRFFF